ncbi:hypothetical protein EX30DRAFT_253389 [Ascodesmis nigricans]|uniref:Uncharacterized protein n=1 Tax=Ascodesmis nigricans TaxID=341454 RepID=A0A4S2MYN5_9PEZI|nr:hypothetical protein EX30DRAFT_253389 [Ascodesmis nigricans]
MRLKSHITAEARASSYFSTSLLSIGFLYPIRNLSMSIYMHSLNPHYPLQQRNCHRNGRCNTEESSRNTPRSTLSIGRILGRILLRLS